jgi:phosphoribosylformylglycinamidine cyclo-ligase
VTEDAYARAGVSQGDADAAVASLVSALSSAAPSDSRQVLASGHYANVVRLDERTGIALSTDGVGTKLLVAEQLGRWDTVGIDCVAMNVNDVVCVGAEPLAMVDYLAVDRADAAVAGAVGIGLARGAELAGIEIVGGELAQLGELINGLDLAGACFGVVALDSLVTGASIESGDPVIGLPSSGLHSNGYTLARSALESIPMDDDRLGRRAAPFGPRRPRPRPHHLGRTRQPPSARGRRRLRDRRSVGRPGDLHPDPGAGGRAG